MKQDIAIIFIGTSVYLNYFRRFHSTIVERFAVGAALHFFLFTENHVSDRYSDVTLSRVRFQNRRDVKLHKFHYIDEISLALGDFDYVFYFDADSRVALPICINTIKSWFESKQLVGVMHPWHTIRETDKKFETDPSSTAYVAPEKFPLLPYHQSCFWGGQTGAVLKMSAAIKEMIDKDIAIGHINRDSICDEIYVNKYFLEHASMLHSLDTPFAHPGSEYERITKNEFGRGYRFSGIPIIVHDNAHQTASWKGIANDGAYFSHGVFAQFFKADLAAFAALEMYRSFNEATPIHLVSDGGDDLSSLAARFRGEYVYETVNNGTRRSGYETTNQYLWLQRIHKACLTTLSTVDWILLLEGDVETFRPLTHFPQYALSGPKRGPAWGPELRAVFLEKFGRLTRPFGLGQNFTGCGGSIFNRQAFVECFEKTPYQEFEAIVRLEPGILKAEDMAISFLFQVNGYDTGGWEDFTGWKDPDKHNFAVAHGNKQFYGRAIDAFKLKDSSEISSRGLRSVCKDL